MGLGRRGSELACGREGDALGPQGRRPLLVGQLELDVAGWVDVHVPLLGHFRQLSLVKRLHLRGAGGLDPLIDSFELQPNQGNATVALSMGVRIRNPSSFQLLSIGVLDFSILTSDGTAFAKVSTVGPVSMRRGVTSLSLTGHLAVPDEESDAFRAVLHDYVSGRASTGLTAVITAASEPLFDAALSSLRLDTSLPGRPGGAHFFDEIAMSLDVPQALTGLVACESKRHTAENITTWTNDALKACCGDLGLKKTGKKDELVERIAEHVDAQSA